MKNAGSKPPISSHALRRSAIAAPEAKPTSTGSPGTAGGGLVVAARPAEAEEVHDAAAGVHARAAGEQHERLPRAPAGCAAAAARSASRQPGAGTASGLRKNSSGADVCSRAGGGAAREAAVLAELDQARRRRELAQQRARVVATSRSRRRRARRRRAAAARARAASAPAPPSSRG